MAEDAGNMKSNSIAHPSVSVVIPAFNAAHTIVKAIDSVLQGTFEDFEIVVCDDASRDDTVAKVTAFDDPRIRVIRNPVNAGEGAARDRAIDIARGRWIALLDADDMYAPERLEILLDAAEAHPDCIVFDEVMECHDTPHGMKPWRKVRPSDAFPGPSTRTRTVTIADWILQPRTVMQPLIPIALIRNNGVRHSDKRCAEDMEYILTLTGRAGAQLLYVPRPMYLYRINPGSMSTIENRNALNVSTLEEAIPLFETDPATVNALRAAAAAYCKKEQYRLFFSGICAFDARRAITQAWKHPWVVPEFARRSVLQIPYHVSRWRHHGKWRRRA